MKPKPIKLICNRYPLMPDLKKHVGVTKYGDTHKLINEFYGLHVAFRKGMDSYASGIIWDCLSVMRDTHIELLLDTIEHTLPNKMNASNGEECKRFSHRMCVTWKIFFDRLDGFEISKPVDQYSFYNTQNFNRSISDTSDDPMYNLIMRNLRSALKIEMSESQDAFENFPYYMYHTN